jgi:tripartite-type tricarboxylate transporter receptor subunit TctC
LPRSSPPPDGYNLVVVVAAHVINASMQSKMPYDPVADVAPVTLIARSPWVIVVVPTLPGCTLKEFVAEPIASTPEDFAAYTKSEHDKFAKLVKAAGIRPE